MQLFVYGSHDSPQLDEAVLKCGALLLVAKAGKESFKHVLLLFGEEFEPAIDGLDIGQIDEEVVGFHKVLIDVIEIG